MIQGRRGELSRWHRFDLERVGEFHNATPLGGMGQGEDKGDDRGVLRAHAGRMKLEVTPQHDGAADEDFAIRDVLIARGEQPTAEAEERGRTVQEQG
jgi:hypothetical protein